MKCKNEPKESTEKLTDTHRGLYQSEENKCTWAHSKDDSM